MTVRRLVLGVAMSALLACARNAAPERLPKEDLAGLVAPLRSGPTLRLLVAGSVLGRPASVELEVSAPISGITTGCFPTPPEPKGTVRLTNLAGEPETLPELQLPAAEVEGRPLSPRPVALIAGADCRLVLGSDVLGAYALRFDPWRWEVALERSSARGTYDAPETDPGFEKHVVPLTKDPSTDRLLAAAKVHGPQEKALVSAFVLTTGRSRSAVSVAAATAAGLEPDGVHAARLGLPATTVRQLRQAGTFSPLRIELSPEVAVDRPTLDGIDNWRQATAQGTLGPDVWGRFEATIDAGAQVLVLRRPKMAGDVRRRTCGGSNQEESCFSLDASNPGGTGLRSTLNVWRDLPTGGRIYVEAVDAEGKPVRAPCTLGFNLPAGDRGATVAQTFPWPELSKAFPGCGDALSTASGAKLLLFEEGSDGQCAGTCAFAMHPRGRGMVCSCANAPGGGTPGQIERSLELFRRFREQDMKRQQPPADDEEPEPVD